MTAQKAPARRFRREDWLTLGLNCLKADGPSGLTLERLCDAAGRTRGSFYHHFEDHDAFIAAMMDHWRASATQSVIDAVESAPPGGQRARRLTDLSLSLDHQLERALRSLGQVNALAAERLAEADEARITFLAKLYRSQNRHSAQKARALAEMEYAAFVGALMIWPQDGERKYAQINKMLRTLTAPSP